MRRVITALGILALVTTVQAQVGPASPRIVSRPMPQKAPAAAVFNAEALLQITARGRVDSVEIVGSSGDTAFDKQFRKSLSDWRFVPAVDASGLPIESSLRVYYKNTGLTTDRTAAAGNVVNDATRFEKMSCKDFYWEYEFINDALPRRLALLDPLLRAPMVNFVAENHPDEAQMKLLHDRYDQVVSDVAKHCRDNPEDGAWKAVFKPAMEAALVAQ